MEARVIEIISFPLEGLRAGMGGLAQRGPATPYRRARLARLPIKVAGRILTPSPFPSTERGA